MLPHVLVKGISDSAPQRVLAAACCGLLCVAGAAAYPLEIESVDNSAISGGDSLDPSFAGGITHFTFDVRHTVTEPRDWLNTAFRIETLAPGVTIYQHPGVDGATSVSPPSLADVDLPGFFPPDSSAAYDTFTNTGPASLVPPGFLTVNLDGTPSAVSSFLGADWDSPTALGFDVSDVNSTSSSSPTGTLARVTFVSDLPLTLTPTGAPVAVIRGETGVRIDGDAAFFNDEYFIYQVPEPAAVVSALLFGALAARRR